MQSNNLQNTMPTSIIPETVIKAVTTGWLGAFGGVAFYLYSVHKGKSFRVSSFFINLVLAFFIWYVVGAFIPDALGQDVRNGLLAIAWFSAYPLLDYLEERGFHIIIDKIWK